MKTKIPVKKYVLDESASWEERHRQLEVHHKEEVEFLIRRIEQLENYKATYHDDPTRSLQERYDHLKAHHEAAVASLDGRLAEREAQIEELEKQVKYYAEIAHEYGSAFDDE